MYKDTLLKLLNIEPSKTCVGFRAMLQEFTALSLVQKLTQESLTDKIQD